MRYLYDFKRQLWEVVSLCGLNLNFHSTMCRRGVHFTQSH